MKFFKKHKTKDKATFNIGIRECRTCENNLRCEECAYPKENEMLKAEIERLNKELHNQRAEKDIFKESYYSAKKKLETAKFEAIKEFADRLKNIYIKDKRYDRPNAHTLIDWLFNNIDNFVKEMAGDDK